VVPDSRLLLSQVSASALGLDSIPALGQDLASTLVLEWELELEWEWELELELVSGLELALA
jgi:hypothetical protein